jgi:endonuclease YncB( thermonuclease family)
MHLIINIMENFNDTNTPLFSFNGVNGMARVVDITDGDTIKAIINFKDDYYKIIVRLNDIDTCETKSKCEENKNLGIEAKKRLYNLITNKTIDSNDKKLIKQELHNNCYLIYLKCYDFDKYGRVLGDIYQNENNNISFSSILIKEKLAYIYGGKTKLTEKEQIELLK